MERRILHIISDACIWNLVPGADCRLTLETCNFYSDPGLARGPGEEGQRRDDFSPRGPEPSGVLCCCFLFHQNCPIF